MNANKGIITLLAAAAALISTGAQAVQNLDAHGQTKVNNALAKKWQQQDPSAKSQNRQVVNVGSRRGGDCNVNVGTVEAGKKGGRQPKDIVVTTKEVINVCK